LGGTLTGAPEGARSDRPLLPDEIVEGVVQALSLAG
jgi:hypothetical protein